MCRPWCSPGLWLVGVSVAAVTLAHGAARRNARHRLAANSLTGWLATHTVCADRAPGKDANRVSNTGGFLTLFCLTVHKSIDTAAPSPVQSGNSSYYCLGTASISKHQIRDRPSSLAKGGKQSLGSRKYPTGFEHATWVSRIQRSFARPPPRSAIFSTKTTLNSRHVGENGLTMTD